MTKKIIVTGGEGRFAKILKKKNKKLNLIFLSKKQCNILNIRSIENCIKNLPLNYTALLTLGQASGNNKGYRITSAFWPHAFRAS